MPEKAKEKMLTQSTIISTYGWTKSLITKFLPAPKLVPNPHYKKASPMQLWKEADVLQAMQTPEFQENFAKANKRKAAAAKAVDTKKALLEAQKTKFLNSIRIQVLPDDMIRAKTLDAKQTWYTQSEFKDDFYLDPSEIPDAYGADELTIQRWVVNYIRHHLVQYNDFLDKICGKVGVQDCYVDTKVILLQKIAEAYPAYAKECRRQISHCKMEAGMRKNAGK